MGERLKCVEQCFSTFFDSRHPSLVIKQYDGTPSYKLLVIGHQIQNLAAPLELFWGTQECRCTPVENHWCRKKKTALKRRRDQTNR